MTALLTLGAVVLAVAVTSVLLRQRDGRVRAADTRLSAVERAALGGDGSWLLVALSARACGSCVQARRVLDSVARDTGARVAAVDVGEQPDFARAHKVLRVPTTLVVDPGGAVRARLSGVPHAGDLKVLVGQ